MSNSIHTFTELLANNSKHFPEILNGHWTFLNGKFSTKSEKKLTWTHETGNFAINYS